MSTLDKPKRNGTPKAGATFTHALTAVDQMRVFTADFSPLRRVKKGCGQRKNRRDRAGRARHAETCRLNQRYPGWV